MDPRFKAFVDSLESSFQSLMAMEPVTLATLPKSTPEGGVYLFSDGENHLYVGRTGTKIGKRLKQHYRGDEAKCAFANQIARKRVGYKADYKAGSKKRRLANEALQLAIKEAKEEIGAMNIRYVEEKDPLKQALLEVYVSVALQTPFNDFSTH